MEFLDNDKLKPEHSSVMVMPAKRHDGRWDLFIILSQKSIDRIKEYDPAELELDKMPEELTDEYKSPERIFVAYATWDEMQKILKAYKEGKGVHSTMRMLLRGRKNRPEMGDGLDSMMARSMKQLFQDDTDDDDKDSTHSCAARIDVQSVAKGTPQAKVEAIKHMMIQAWVSGRKLTGRMDQMLDEGKCQMDEELQKHIHSMAKMIGFACLICGVNPKGIVDSECKLEEIDPDDEGKDD